jgi:tripartite-type tricarboxylate transporter receptor subunit TctC
MSTKIILSAEPGSLFDRVGRAFGAQFEAALEAPVTFENVGDSSGAPGAEAAAKAPRDGSTLVIGNKGAITSHPHIAKTFQVTDFAAIGQFAEAPIAIAVKADGPYRNLADLFDATRRKPDTISFATPNPYHTQRLALAMFAATAGLRFKFMILPGGNPAAIDKIVDGTVDFAFLAAHNYVAARKAGRIRILGIASRERLSFLPDDPTCREQGFDLVTAIWLGLLCPAGVPSERLATLRVAIVKTFSDPKTAPAIDALHMVPAFLAHDDFARVILSDSEAHKKVLHELGAI